jgi:hypothetical protein
MGHLRVVHARPHHPSASILGTTVSAPSFANVTSSCGSVANRWVIDGEGWERFADTLGASVRGGCDRALMAQARSCTFWI